MHVGGGSGDLISGFNLLGALDLGENGYGMDYRKF